MHGQQNIKICKIYFELSIIYRQDADSQRLVPIFEIAHKISQQNVDIFPNSATIPHIHTSY